MSQAAPIDINKLWGWVTEQVKAKTTSPGLWRSMEAARAIVLEGDELVLGFPAEQSQMRGLLLDNRHRRMIEQIMETGTKRRLQLRVIDGESLADWENMKAHALEAALLAQRARPTGGTSPAATADGAASSWEDVGEKLIRRIGTIPTRAMPSVQGRLLLEAVDALVEAHPRLMPEQPSEQDERALSRVLDRLGERLGASASTIGYLLYAQLRKAGE